jgi:acetylornithine deacetylase/succinyl-diaminopimelate desuccinylase-like protein
MTWNTVSLSQQLIRFDTSNPPGPMQECARFLRDVLIEGGVQATLIGPDPERPNLVARVPGRGTAAPLLLQGHLDVVPVTGQSWSRAPFAADVEDGLLWGRGAVDMKGQLAMMVTALLDLVGDGTPPAGDVVLAVVSDEENGGPAGAHALVADHRELFDGVRYAIGEDGGAFLDLGSGPRVHPIVVSEKRACWMRLGLTGTGGHGSRPPGPGAGPDVLRRTLNALDDGLLKRHLTPAARVMLERLIEVSGPEIAPALTSLLDQRGLPDQQLPGPDQTLAAEALSYLRAVTHHTAVPTRICAPSGTNVVPSRVELDVDGRLLPGTGGTDEMVGLLRARLGAAGVTDYELEVLVEGEPLPEPDLGPCYQRLLELAGQVEPDAVAVPMITTASTDARLFAQLGISCYGWFPAPHSDRDRTRLHQVDEKIPVTALQAGTEAYRELLRSFP